MADRFYTPDALPLGEYALVGPDAHHLITVRRFDVGDHVTLFNGDGHDYPATVTAVSNKRVWLAVEAGIPVDRERATPIWVASAIPKGDRADYLVEKLTELGVTRFTPLICERSVTIPKAATEAKFRKQVIEASKQCGRNRLMVVEPATPFSHLLSRPELPVDRWLLHTDAVHGVPLPPRASGAMRLIAVGPEGGVTAGEVAQALKAGWRAATLGPRVLRIETAAVIGCGAGDQT